MRVGYGYRRTEGDFADLDCESVYIDTPKSDRSARADMFQVGLRERDTLVMLGRGDLGYGRELKRLRERLAKMSVEIEYVDKPAPDAGPVGAPRKFDPEPEHDAEIRTAWHDEDCTITGVFKTAKRLGYEPELHHLKYRYGPRFAGQ